MKTNNFTDFCQLRDKYNIAPETIDLFKTSQEFVLNQYQLSYLDRKAKLTGDENLTRIV